MIQVLRFLSPVLVAVSINKNKEQMSSEGVAPHISIRYLRGQNYAVARIQGLRGKGSASIAQTANQRKYGRVHSDSYTA